MSEEQPKVIEPPPQPHRCSVGHLQPTPFAFTYQQNAGAVTLTTGPICVTCLYAYVGRNFRTRPVVTGDEA